MNIIEKIKQKREESFMKKMLLGKATKEEILRKFEKSADKKKFMQDISIYRLDDDIKESLKRKIREMCESDKNFIINNLPDLCKNMIIGRSEAKEILMSQLKAEEIISNIELFSIFGVDYEQVALLKNVDSKLISSELLKVLSIEYREKFINSLSHKDVTREMLDCTSDTFKVNLAQKYIMDSSIDSQVITGLFSEDTLLRSMRNIVKEDATLLNDRSLKLIPDKNKSEIIALAKMNYVSQNARTYDKNLNCSIQEMMSNGNFVRYLQYRQDNFNIGEGKSEKLTLSDKKNNNTIIEVFSSIKEYNSNSELINDFLNSNMQNNEKTKLLLRYYILDNDVAKKVTNIDELLEYPNDVLKRQIESISSNDIDRCKDIIARNLTGFSLEEYKNYSNMFLESHSIEDILKANNEDNQKLANINIVKEIINLMETMDNDQIREFANNIATRNYNELVSGDFSLVSLRENYKTFISNIKSEYGKEFNQSLGYSISDTEQVQVDGQKVNIHEISGEFKFLLHMSRSDEIKERTCMSFISEGHYEVATGEECKSKPDTIFFLFDDLPEDLLYASANSNMTSNTYGDARSKFMTAENTILNAEKDIEETNPNAPKFTEQVYFFEGFDKSGKFVRIYPKAMGTFEKQPNQKTLQVAAKYGIDVIKIPEMQTNLENMLKKGMVTPGLVKGINGFSDRIIQIISSKNILSKEDKISLKLLQQKYNDERELCQIEELLQKPTSKGKEDIEELIDDINISQINAISTETRQIINIINNPEISRGN